MDKHMDDHIRVKPGESIQRAINRASAGAVIDLAPGVYKENLSIEKSLTIRGIAKTPQEIQIIGTVEHAPAIKIAEYESEWEMVRRLIAGKGEIRGDIPEGMRIKVTIESLTCQASNGEGILIDGSVQVALQGCHLVDSITGLKFGGSREIPDALRETLSQAQHDGIDILSLEFALLSQVVLEDCFIASNHDGIILEGEKTNITGSSCSISQNMNTGLVISHADTAQVVLKACSFLGNTLGGIFVFETGSYELSLTHCTVSDNGYGLDAFNSTGTIKLFGNHFLNNQRAGIESFNSDTELSGSNNEMRGNGVDLIGVASAFVRKPLVPETRKKRVLVPDDYQTLQQAIDGVAPGGTISISRGRFQGGGTIWKPVVIQGSASEKTVLEALYEGAPCISVLPNANGVRLFDLEILGQGGRTGDALVDIAGNTELHRVQIYNSRTGLAVDKADVLLDNCELTDNLSGLFVDRGSATLRDCIVSRNENEGIFVGSGCFYGRPGPARLQIESCSIFKNGDGVRAHISDKLTIRNSSFSYNTGFGLNLDWPGKATIENSELSNNDRAGLVMKSGQMSLQKCIISENGSSGLHVSDAGVKLSNCIIEKNNEHGLALDNAARAMLRSCIIRSNVEDGLRAENANSMDSGGSFHTDEAIQVTVHHCKVLKNNGHGISLYDGVQASILYSLMADNGGAGLRTTDRVEVWLQNSRLLRNQTCGIKAVVDPAQAAKTDHDLKALIDRLFKKESTILTRRSTNAIAFAQPISGSNNLVPGPTAPDGNQHRALEPTYPGWPWPKGFLKEA